MVSDVAGRKSLQGIDKMQLATLKAWIGHWIGKFIGKAGMRDQVYPPERHYMRGPGPKAKARLSGAPKQADPRKTHVNA